MWSELFRCPVWCRAEYPPGTGFSERRSSLLKIPTHLAGYHVLQIYVQPRSVCNARRNSSYFSQFCPQDFEKRKDPEYNLLLLGARGLHRSNSNAREAQRNQFKLVWGVVIETRTIYTNNRTFIVLSETNKNKRIRVR